MAVIARINEIRIIMTILITIVIIVLIVIIAAPGAELDFQFKVAHGDSCCPNRYGPPYCWSSGELPHQGSECDGACKKQLLWQICNKKFQGSLIGRL